MTDLSLVPVEEIWDELKRRNDAVVLLEMKNLDGEHESVQVGYKGGKFTCLGMVENARLKLMSDMYTPGTYRGEV